MSSLGGSSQGLNRPLLYFVTRDCPLSLDLSLSPSIISVDQRVRSFPLLLIGILSVCRDNAHKQVLDLSIPALCLFHAFSALIVDTGEDI